MDAQTLGLPCNHLELERVSHTMQALSNPQRLKILCTLGDGEVVVQDIMRRIGVQQSVVSQQLGMMRQRGLVVARKQANYVYYRISDERILTIIQMMNKVFCQSATQHRA